MVGTAILDKSVDASSDIVGIKAPTLKIRRASYALNKKKLTKNLKKDALISMYETTVNNHEQNVNIKCSSGFFLEVASPGLLDLAKQASHTKPLTFNTVAIICTNSRNSLDNINLHLNIMYSYDIFYTDKMDTPIATVTIHSHTTTKLIQLQGFKLVLNVKAPVWFYNNVLKDTLEREAETRKQNVDVINSCILDKTTCTLCKKDILLEEKSLVCPSCSLSQHKKCSSIKSSRTWSQPSSWKCDPCLSGDNLGGSQSRKRPINSVTPSDEFTAPISKLKKTKCS